MAWDTGLSGDQRRAASHIGGPARILAGPGTGKTRVLTNRVAFLMQEQHIPANEIVVITFTRAAANELRSRLVETLGLSPKDLPVVRTLHSFALFTLLSNSGHTNLPQPLRVADDFEEKHVLVAELSAVLGRPPTDIKEALQAYEATWNTLNPKHDEWERIPDRLLLEQKMRDLCDIYGFVLRGQLVFKLVELLEANPLLGDSIGIKHVLVDEYQDLNACDLRAIDLLEQSGAELFVVGDDDQCIYQFRHAHPAGIRMFTGNRDPVGDYGLTVCHRCPQNIVEMGNRLIAGDRNRLPKRYQSGSVSNCV